MAIVSSVSTALTEGIRVTVKSVYVPEQSAPRAHRYVFDRVLMCTFHTGMLVFQLGSTLVPKLQRVHRQLV